MHKEPHMLPRIILELDYIVHENWEGGKNISIKTVHCWNKDIVKCENKCGVLNKKNNSVLRTS